MPFLPLITYSTDVKGELVSTSCKIWTGEEKYPDSVEFLGSKVKQECPSPNYAIIF